MHSSHVLIRSPWQNQLLGLARSARHKVVAITPYITRDALASFVDSFHNPRELDVVLGTTLSFESVAAGSLDIRALAWACDNLPKLRLNHIPRLHAKVYIADDSCAIVTSGNLTMASLLHNNEYGIGVFDRDTVLGIARDVASYTELGSRVPCVSVRRLAALASHFPSIDANRNLDSLDESTREAKDEFDHLIRELRGNTGEARTGIFARTVLHVLRNGPLRTRDIQSMVSDIHPDLCDDNVERVINGVRFGKRWKHDVRNAQQFLKRRGQVVLVDGAWRLE